MWFIPNRPNPPDPAISGHFGSRISACCLSSHFIKLPAMNQTANEHTITSQLSIPSDCQEMTQLDEFLDKFLSQNDFQESEADDIIVAVQEGVTNAIIHGNNQSTKEQVNIRLQLSKYQLKITVTDHGSGFDMDAIADPTHPENRLKSSGRGMMFIRTFMDEVISRTLPNGHELVMVRNR